MEEFEIFKEALERIGARLKIRSWVFDDYKQDLIEDLTYQVSYWFTNGQLTDIDNDNDNDN